MEEPDRLSMTIALDAVRHLGMNLYSSLPPVLSELVANAYDARARRVDIKLTKDEATIQDDGIGMDRRDAQSKYLVVGRDKRAEDTLPAGTADPFPDWPTRDMPMGRKGIGKLAMFSIASIVDVYSVKSGRRVAFRMERDKIEQAASRKEQYYPEELPPAPDLTVGTRVLLRGLRRQRAISADLVLKALARRFSVIDVEGTGKRPVNEFSVYVDGTKLTVEHWDIFGKLQYMWFLGPESKHYQSRCPRQCRFTELSQEVKGPGEEVHEVTGWIGTVTRPEQLKSSSGDWDINDNYIVVDCRGKVAIANFLHQFGESGVYASYLAGYIRADFLDDDRRADIATSDRERMKDDDSRVGALKSYVQKILKRVQADWTTFRRESAEKEATQDPIIADWVGGLTQDEQADAKHLLGRLGAVRFSEEDKAQVTKHAILAFERLRVRHRLHLLRNAPDEALSTIATMFALESDLENALYAEIASQRLEVIRRLEALVDKDAKERIIQQHVFEHLWLLEPSWTMADQLNSKLEQSVKREFGNVKLTKEEKAARLDVRYRKSGGIHIIVELKKPSVQRDVYQLMGQVKRYRDALGKCLLQVDNERTPNIQCVCLVGTRPDIRDKDDQALLAGGVRILTYDQVISDSCKRFAEYLAAQKNYTRIQGILARLDATGPAE